MKRKFILVIIIIVLFGIIVNVNNNILSKSIKSVIPDPFKIIIKKVITNVPFFYKEKKLKLSQVESNAKSKYLLKEKIGPKEKKVQSNFYNYELKIFPLPFPSYKEANSPNILKQWRGKPVAYLEQINDKIILASKNGDFFSFKKKNIELANLNLKKIDSNIEDLYKLRLTGHSIRDLLIIDDLLYVSLTRELKKNKLFYCYNTLILNATFNTNYLNFKNFFTYDECQYKLNQSSGGRMFPFESDKILFTTGDFLNERTKNKTLSQDKDSIFGKIISIDINTKKFQVISMGSRNPQGLYYDKDNGIIIHTEHGPKGGDEININLNIDNQVIENFGWPISSYGKHYDGKYRKHAPLFKSHDKYGFIEPIKYFTPSIGISEIIKIPTNFHKSFVNDFYVSSLGWENQIHEGDLSLHHIRLDKNFNKIIFEDIIKIEERIRDIIYLKYKNVFVLLLENTPAIGFLRLIN